MAAGLVIVVRIALHSITQKEKPTESNRELQKNQRELKTDSGAVLAAQHFALSMAKEAQSCCQLLEDMEKQLDAPHMNIKSVGVASAESNV